MELTGKALIDFWAWYFRPDVLRTLKRWSAFKFKVRSIGPKDAMNSEKVRFIALSDSEKYGVYEDWFDSVGMHIQLTPYFDSVKKVMLWFFTLENKRCVHLNSHLENKAKTRPEARTAAIKKADKLYNAKR
jgi:hypothetical protein